MPANGDSEADSARKTEASPAKVQFAPSRFASSARISMSFFALPRGGNAGWNRWTRPAKLVKDPPRSAKDAEGRTACAARESAPLFVATWAKKETLDRS